MGKLPLGYIGSLSTIFMIFFDKCKTVLKQNAFFKNKRYCPWLWVAHVPVEKQVCQQIIIEYNGVSATIGIVKVLWRHEERQASKQRWYCSDTLKKSKNQPCDNAEEKALPRRTQWVRLRWENIWWRTVQTSVWLRLREEGGGWRWS